MREPGHRVHAGAPRLRAHVLIDKDATLWAGYALLGARHRVYFSGDTGLFPAMREIGARLGPFDLTMIEVGQYHRAWPDWHIGPEQAVVAHGMVGGRVMLPMHWGLFTLAPHGWTEPIERALAAGGDAGATLVTPRPGESIEPESAPASARWWPSAAVADRRGAPDRLDESELSEGRPVRRDRHDRSGRPARVPGRCRRHRGAVNRPAVGRHGTRQAARDRPRRLARPRPARSAARRLRRLLLLPGHHVGRG